MLTVTPKHGDPPARGDVRRTPIARITCADNAQFRTAIKDHAEPLIIRGVLSWLVCIRDFFWCGLLGRVGPRRLFDDPPFGAFIYGIVSAAVKRRLPTFTRH